MAAKNKQTINEIMTIKNDLLKFMQTISKKLSFFTGIAAGFFHSSNGKPLKELSQSNLYYQCSETPLQIFIDCLCHKRFERLIKSGKPSQDEILNAWNELFTEYCDLSGSNEMNEVLQVTKKIGVIQAKQTAIALSVIVLSHRNSEISKDNLRQLGFNYDFDAALVDDLQRVISAAKSYEIELKSLQKRYEALTSKGGKSTITDAYFKRILVDLSKFMGFQLKATSTTVEEFLMIKNSYERDLKARAQHGK